MSGVALLDQLHHLQLLVKKAQRHECLEDPKYEPVAAALHDANRAVTVALEGWPA